jgi:transposase
MIGPGTDARVLMATRPVDFRKGPDPLAALIKVELGADRFTGVVYVFRAKALLSACLAGSRRARRPDQAGWWDGTGLCLMAKALLSACLGRQPKGAWDKVASAGLGSSMA